MNTKDKLLKLLREEPRTIAELSSELGLARNAITFQLDRLMSDGLVQHGEIRRPRRAGKPAQEFISAPGSEDAKSAAYAPFTNILLRVLSDRMNEAEKKKVFEAVGRNMAREASLAQSGNLENDARAALDVVNSLGATAELEETDEDLLIKNVSCPLATAVRTEPRVCDAVAAFFSEATGCKTQAQCIRNEQLICKYRIKK